MKNTGFLNSCKAIVLLQLIVFTSFQAYAQYEDKSYLKKGVTDNHRTQIIPDSKYGEVVSQYNLDEALKNPDKYRSARFYQAGLKEFPEQLFLFKNLEEIDLSFNQISSLPAKLSEFKLLKGLYVISNKITAIGSEIINCSQLEVLQIDNNPLQTISTDIAKMINLEEFTMGAIAQECKIPYTFWSLTGLKKIKITNSNLTEIPVEIQNLKQLDELCLSHNAITNIPNELYSLNALTYLNLGYNKINSVSKNISTLTNLYYLGVFYNPVTAIPNEIASLKNLHYISCWNTNIPSQELEKIKARLPQTKVHDTETDLH